MWSLGRDQEMEGEDGSSSHRPKVLSTASTHKAGHAVKKAVLLAKTENKSVLLDRGLAAASKTDSSLCSVLKEALPKQRPFGLTVQSQRPLFIRAASNCLGEYIIFLFHRNQGL